MQSYNENSDFGLLSILGPFKFLGEDMFHEDDLSMVCTALNSCQAQTRLGLWLRTTSLSSSTWSPSQGPGKSLTLLLPVDTVDALQIGHGFAYL